MASLALWVVRTAERIKSRTLGYRPESGLAMVIEGHLTKAKHETPGLFVYAFGILTQNVTLNAAPLNMKLRTGSLMDMGVLPVFLFVGVFFTGGLAVSSSSRNRRSNGSEKGERKETR